MSYRQRKVIPAITLFVIVAITQTYVGVSFAARTAGINALTNAPQAITGILTTAGNKPIMVNGASANTGATILSGATIETPDGVSATVNIPGHGSLQIAANTKLTLEIDQNGNLKVNLIQGCVGLHTIKGTSGEVDNAQGVIGKTDPAKNGVVETCPVKVAGAAAAGAGGLFGLGTAATVAIIGGGVAAVAGIALANRGTNASPSTP
jgi:hypothetical protein